MLLSIRAEWHLLKLKTPDAARINIFSPSSKSGLNYRFFPFKA
jgi:hypothetical protein